jgi:tetratricopeptide (TPR) repeat protein
MLSLALNYKLSGLNASSYHWLNLILHLANVALVFFFIRMLSGGRLWTTVVTALLFGIHPMHVESVAWISERKDVLYAFFYLIALITYLRYLDTKRVPWLIITLVVYILSAASKPAAVVLPLSLLAVDWFRRRPFSTRTLLEKAPFFAVSVAVGLITIGTQQAAGAIADPRVWNPAQRALFACLATVMYVVKLFVPTHLSAIYPLPPTSVTRFPPEYYAAPVILATLLPLIVYLFRRSRPVIFGIAFFFINIFLVLQFVTVGGSPMAERYTYIPYIGLVFALAWWLDEPARAGGTVRGVARPVLAGIFLLLTPFCAVQTWKRCTVWHDPETFWNDTIQKFPGRIVDAYYNRANYYVRTGRTEKGLADYNQAIVLNPKVPRIWFNKGLLLAQQNQIDSALVCFDRVLEFDPTMVGAWSDRGAMKIHKGDFQGAVADFTRALALDPRYRDAYLNRALAYDDMRDFEKSIADRRRALELDPNNPANDQEFASIAVSLQALNKNQDAIAEYDKAIRAAGNNERVAGYYLARSYAWNALRDRARAAADAHEALRRGTKVDPAYLRSLGG